MFLIGLFATPGGNAELILLAGGGGLLIFIGIASLSATVARPVAGAIGTPIRRMFGVPGKIARDNAMRAPRRTARTASALMIGVSLISAAALFTSSVRDTFGRILNRAVTADFIILDPSFLGLPAQVAERITALEEIQAISPVRPTLAQIDGDQVGLAAIDPAAMPDLADFDVSEGGYEGLTADDGVMIHRDKAEDLGVGVGDTVDVTFSNGIERALTVAGLYDDNSLAGDWIISAALLDAVSEVPPRDQLVLVRVAEGVDLDAARVAIEQEITDFPQAEVQSNTEFREDQEGQIDQLLIVITTLLGFAIVISFFGIAITLALSVFERTREIGLLRAVGMSRRQLRRAVRWEAVIVSVFGVVVGVVVGTLIGMALAYAVPNSFIDGITVPWATLVMVAILAVVAAVIAALYPAYKASRMNVLEAIATE
jgi:putative ABC transport system permease protein